MNTPRTAFIRQLDGREHAPADPLATRHTQSRGKSRLRRAVLVFLVQNRLRRRLNDLSRAARHPRTLFARVPDAT